MRYFGEIILQALIFVLIKVKLYSSAMRVCWQPPKRFTSLTQKNQLKRAATKFVKKKKKIKICPASSIPSSLHHKKKVFIQRYLIFCTDSAVFSRHLLFLSLQVVHHIQEGIMFHHIFWLLLPPPSN